MSDRDNDEMREEYDFSELCYHHRHSISAALSACWTRLLGS